MNQVQTEKILQECSEFMTQRISSSMLAMMNKAEDTLFDMASKEKGTAKSAQYFDAVRLIRTKKDEMQVRFAKRFVTLFKYSVWNSIVNSDRSDFTLSKVGHSSFVKESNSDEGKMLEDAIIKVKVDCKYALLNLDKRIGTLLENIDVYVVENPMQPETVFEAFWESCRDVKMRPEVRLLFVNLFEKFVGFELKYLYEDLNSYLAQTSDNIKYD